MLNRREIKLPKDVVSRLFEWYLLDHRGVAFEMSDGEIRYQTDGIGHQTANDLVHSTGFRAYMAGCIGLKEETPEAFIEILRKAKGDCFMLLGGSSERLVKMNLPDGESALRDFCIHNAGRNYLRDWEKGAARLAFTRWTFGDRH
jgi:hypothetical protein